MGFYKYQVVQDFFHQHYYINICFFIPTNTSNHHERKAWFKIVKKVNWSQPPIAKRGKPESRASIVGSRMATILTKQCARKNANSNPIASMYGMYIPTFGLIYMGNLGKYTGPMDGMGMYPQYFVGWVHWLLDFCFWGAPNNCVLRHATGV